MNSAVHASLYFIVNVKCDTEIVLLYIYFLDYFWI